MNAEPRPFIKWVGGKTQLVPQLLEHIPSTWNPDTDLYVEPFVGAGALFFALRPKNAILNDANEVLMTTYERVRDSVEELIFALQERQLAYKRRGLAFYLEVRERFNAAKNTADFIFLNKAGFNGLYRVNKSGAFNVPWGKNPKATICDPDNLRLCSAALRHLVGLEHRDFGDFGGESFQGALVYADPPYVPVSKTANFTDYTAEGFTYADQIRLLARAVEWRRAGAHVILSQADDESLIEQYRRCGFTCDAVKARRAINSKGDSRGAVGEYIITGAP